MKKVFMMAGLSLLLVACGAKKTETAPTEEVVEPEVEEVTVAEIPEPEPEPEPVEAGYRVPFEFSIDHLKYGWVYDENNKNYPDEEYIVSVKLEPNGRATGHYKYVTFNYPDKSIGNFRRSEVVQKDFDLNGKWSTSSRSMGEGMQKVYAIDFGGISDTWYLPADGDYLYKSWIECEDFDTQKAWKVNEIKQL